MDNLNEFLPFLIPLVAVQFALLGYTLHHILTHRTYKRGTRTTWLIITLVLKGATVGKWLLRFRVCRTGGEQAPIWRLILRYIILYNVVLLFVLIPHFALGLPEGAVQLITELSRIIGIACLIFYMAVAWMFPTRDYPWGTLSGTHVMRIPHEPAAQ